LGAKLATEGAQARVGDLVDEGAQVRYRGGWVLGGPGPLLEVPICSGLKGLYVFNNDGTHLNIPGYTIITATDTTVFQRSMSVTLGFLDRWVRNRAEGLENVVGPAARSDTRLNALS
jgi:hypothetical protein